MAKQAIRQALCFAVSVTLLPMLFAACAAKAEGAAELNPEIGDKTRISAPPFPSFDASDPVGSDASKPGENAGAADSAKADSGVMDLRQMEGNTLYAQLFSMSMAPQDFDGKRVQMRGTFRIFKDQKANGEIVGQTCTVTVSDLAGCCQQGLRLEFAESNPTLPAEGSEISLEGRCKLYVVGGQNYLGLVDVKLLDN